MFQTYLPWLISALLQCSNHSLQGVCKVALNSPFHSCIFSFALPCIWKWMWGNFGQNCALLLEIALHPRFKYIVMQMRKGNCEKGYWSVALSDAHVLCARVFGTWTTTRPEPTLHIRTLYRRTFASRLDFRRSLESGLCSSPKETAGRVTRWPCLWRNSKKLIYASPMSLEMKSDAKFLVYLAYITRPCLPKKFEFTVSSVHFCTLRNCYKFLRCSNGWLKVQAIILRKI